MIKANLWRLERSEKGILSPGPWFWPRTLIWLVALFTCAAFAFFASFQLRGWLHLSAGAKYYIAILIPAAALALYSLAVSVGEKRHARELALSDAVPCTLLGGVIGFVFMAMSLVLLWICHLNSVALGQWKDWFSYFVFNSYISAVLEELGFRAILLRLLARMFGPIPGLMISAVLFAVAHASHAPSVALALLAINGGMQLGILFMVSGSLWTPIGAHLAYDFTEWSLFGVGDKDGLLNVAPSPQHPAWLTGGTFGPDGSILSALVSLSIIAGVVAFSAFQANRKQRSTESV